MRRAQWGVLWRNPSSRFPRPPLRSRALGPRVYLYVSAATASLVVISISKGRNVEARLFIRRLSTCSLTDDLFQPVVEIARRTFPPLALLPSMSVLTALTCFLPNPVRL